MKRHEYALSLVGLITTLFLALSLGHLTPAEASAVTLPALAPLVTLMSAPPNPRQRQKPTACLVSIMFLQYGVVLCSLLITHCSVVDTALLSSAFSLLAIPVLTPSAISDEVAQPPTSKAADDQSLQEVTTQFVRGTLIPEITSRLKSIFKQ